MKCLCFWRLCRQPTQSISHSSFNNIFPIIFVLYIMQIEGTQNHEKQKPKKKKAIHHPIDIKFYIQIKCRTPTDRSI